MTAFDPMRAYAAWLLAEGQKRVPPADAYADDYAVFEDDADDALAAPQPPVQAPQRPPERPRKRLLVGLFALTVAGALVAREAPVAALLIPAAELAVAVRLFVLEWRAWKASKSRAAGGATSVGVRG